MRIYLSLYGLLNSTSLVSKILQTSSVEMATTKCYSACWKTYCLQHHNFLVTYYNVQIGYGSKSLTCQDPKVLKKHLQSTTIMLGSEPNDWSTSARMPNWYDPAVYIEAA
jgi:hypothetical protein